MNSTTACLSAPESEPTLAQSLLSRANDAIKASLVDACDQRSLTARSIYEALRGVDPHYVPTQIIDGRKPRSYVLQFARDIKRNRAFIPGFRLVWVRRRGLENVRAREGALVLTGSQADTFQPSDIADMLPVKPARQPRDTLADLLTRSGLSIEAAADRSGISLQTLQALVDGTGHARLQTIHQLAILLSATFDEVKAACAESVRPKRVNGKHGCQSTSPRQLPPDTSISPATNAVPPVPPAMHVQFTILPDGRVIDVVSRAI